MHSTEIHQAAERKHEAAEGNTVQQVSQEKSLGVSSK